MTVRPATVYDLNDLFRLKVALAQEESQQWSESEEEYPFQAQNREEFALERLPILYDQSKLYLVAVDSTGLLVGYLLGSINQRKNTAPAIVFSVHEMYVDPNNDRRSRASVARAFNHLGKAWARQQGASSIEISCIGAAKQINKWTRKGYKPFYVMLHKELD